MFIESIAAKFHLQDKRPNITCCLVQQLENVANTASLSASVHSSGCHFSIWEQQSWQNLIFFFFCSSFGFLKLNKLSLFDLQFVRDRWPFQHRTALYSHSETTWAAAGGEAERSTLSNIKNCFQNPLNVFKILVQIKSFQRYKTCHFWPIKKIT